MKILWIFALICCTWQVTRVQAQEATFELDGTSYATYFRAGEAAVVTTPLSASLTRDASHRVPGCTDVERNLSRLKAEIETCKKLKQPSDACVFVRSLVDHVRFIASTIGVNELEQRWTVDPRATTPRDVKAVVAAAARATRLPLSAVRYLDNPQAVGRVDQLQVVVAPNGKSWASKLLGLVDLNEMPPAVSEDGSLITRDHVLACGLQAGDVSLVWKQETSLARYPTLLTQDQSVAVYQALAASPSVQNSNGAERRELQIGGAIGRALSALKIGQDDDAKFDATVRLAFAAFFDPGTLSFADGLSDAEVRALINGVAFEYVLPWSARVSTP